MNFPSDTPASFALLMIALAIVYWLVSLMPLWWPAIVSRKHQSFPKRWLFAVTVCTFSYGTFFFLFFAMSIPALVYATFFAPNFVQMGQPVSGFIVGFGRLSEQYWWLAMPVMLVASAMWFTRKLILHWPALVHPGHEG